MKIFRAGVLAAAGTAAGALLQKRRQQGKIEEQEQVGRKYYAYYQLLNQWLNCREIGKQTVDFFREEQISSIAIYGMGDLADRLMDSLKDSGIEIRYGIDQDVCCTNARIAEVYSPDDPLPEVDAIVVTPFTSFKEIQDLLLSHHCACHLIPLDEVIYSL